MLVMTVYGLSMVALYGASTLYHWKIATPKELILKAYNSINFLVAAAPLQSSITGWARGEHMLVVM